MTGWGRRVEGFECLCSDIWFYAYRGSDTLWQSDDNWGSIDFLSANGLKVATVDSSTGNCYCTVKYYHLDMLGSTRLVTNPSKSVTFSNGYQPYGQDNGTPNSSENYKFTGKPVSQTTGLYYYYQRWYDPSIGRFISADPDPETCRKCANLYTYAKDQPTRLVDRSGARSADVIAGEYQDRVQRLAAMQNQPGPCEHVSADVCLGRLGIQDNKTPSPPACRLSVLGTGGGDCAAALADWVVHHPHCTVLIAWVVASAATGGVAAGLAGEASAVLTGLGLSEGAIAVITSSGYATAATGALATLWTGFEFFNLYGDITECGRELSS